MKLSKDDLLKKISDKVTDEDLVIELLEDVTDSMEVATEEVAAEDEEKIAMAAELEKVKDELLALKAKYKERFLGSEEMAEEVEEVEEVVEDDEPRKFEDLIDEDGGIK